MKKILKLALVAVLFSSLIISCSKDEEDADFVGTWVSITTDEGDYSDTAEIKETLVLTNSSFSILSQEKVDGKFVDVEGQKGSLSYSGNKLTVTIKEFGDDKDKSDKNYSITWYKEGSPEFEAMKALLTLFGQSLTIESTYSIANGKLTIVSKDETMVYTKQ